VHEISLHGTHRRSRFSCAWVCSPEHSRLRRSLSFCMLTV
jgi:hypothetical protein